MEKRQKKLGGRPWRRGGRTYGTLEKGSVVLLTKSFKTSALGKSLAGRRPREGSGGIRGKEEENFAFFYSPTPLEERENPNSLMLRVEEFHGFYGVGNGGVGHLS